MHNHVESSSLPPWDLTETRRFLWCRRSMRLAARLFAGTAGVVFTVALLFYLVAPAYAAAALHAMMDFFQSRAEWAYR